MAGPSSRAGGQWARSINIWAWVGGVGAGLAAEQIGDVCISLWKNDGLSQDTVRMERMEGIPEY